MNSYLEALRQAVILFPVLAVLFTVPYIAFHYHKYGSVLSLRILIVYSFFLYLLCVYCLVILPLPSAEAAAELHGHQVQLVPFAFVGDMLRDAPFDWSRPATWLSLVNTWAFLTTLFNLFMTMPFGMYLRYYFRCGWRKTLLLSFLLSLFFELTQLTGLYFLYPGSYRVCDVDDLIVNTCGSMLGYLLAYFPMRFLPSREELDNSSYARGQQVSFLRRLVAFGCDGFFFLLLGGPACALLSVPGPDLRPGPGLWAAYLTLAALVFRGQTPGYRLTRLRLVSAGGGAARWHQCALRYALLFLMLFWGVRLLLGLAHLLEAFGCLTPPAALLLRGLICAGYLFLLLFQAVRAAMRRPLFYERWSRTRLVSTIDPAEGSTG